MDFIYTIIDMSLTGSFVILLILLARLAMKKLPKKFSYLLWSVAAFRLCIPFSFQAIFSVFGFTKHIDAPIINNSNGALAISRPSAGSTIIINSNGVTENAGSIVENITDTTVPATPVIDTDTVVISPDSFSWEDAIPYILMAIWAIGFTAMLVYSIVSYVKLQRKLSTAILIRDNIYISDKIDSPFSIGFIKPKIYLPCGLSEQGQE